MDWKLILTILCLTGQASTTDTSTTAPASNATTATSTSNNSTTVATNTAIASATVATNTAIASATVATNTTIASATVSTNTTIASATVSTNTTIASATVSSNTTIASATVSSNTTNTSTAVATPTAPPTVFSLIFSINEPFSADLSNSSSQLFKDKSANITSQVGPLYKKKFPNFIRMIIQSFSNGSIVTNSTLEFSSDNVNVNNVTSTLQQGLTNLTFPVVQGSINATTIATATVAPNTTNTSTTVATPTTPPSLVFSLIFSINETFSADLSNSSSQLFKDKSANIISQVEPLYKKKFSNFIRMIIQSFSNGSIVTNSTLEFSSGNVTVNNVTSTLQEGLTNLTIPVIQGSINATTIASATVAPNTTIASTTIATTTAPPSVFSLIFSINETFSADLSNSSSQLFKDKSANITSQVGPLYKKKFSNYRQMIIKSFSNGSIVTNSTVEFNSDNVTVNDVKSTLVDGANSLTFPIDPSSIKVTQIVGNSVPSVIASSVSMMWMSLLTLLLSFALHI